MHTMTSKIQAKEQTLNTPILKSNLLNTQILKQPV